MKRRELREGLDLTYQKLEQRYDQLEQDFTQLKENAEVYVERNLVQIRDKLSFIKQIVDLPKEIVKEPWFKVAASFYSGVLSSSLISGLTRKNFNVTTVKRAISGNHSLNLLVKDLMYLAVTTALRDGIQKASNFDQRDDLSNGAKTKSSSSNFDAYSVTKH